MRQPPRSMVRRLTAIALAAFLAAFLAACAGSATTPAPNQQATSHGRQGAEVGSGPGAGTPANASAAVIAVPAELAVRIFDARSADDTDDSDAPREIAFAALIAALTDPRTGADAVFLGEMHVDDATHRLEHLVLRALIARGDRPVVLSLEMFEADVQPVLDRYIAGEIDEPTFLGEARPWGNYRTGYRPLIETARRNRLPVIAANTPRLLRMRVSRGGREALEALSPEERAQLPAEIFPASAAYWKRVQRATRGHLGGATDDPEALLYNGQNLWDNSMGDAVARALSDHEGARVLHVTGSFHSQYRSGSVAQFLRRAPKARALTLAVMPTDDLATIAPARDAERADFLLYAQRRARGLSEGTHAVVAPGELRYRLKLPPGATDAEPVPLLIWLGERGFRAQDAERYWAAALGTSAAVAVVEAPYRSRAEDFHLGGHWYWPDSFEDDLKRLNVGLERLVEFVTRRYPIDAARVVIAGTGTGATVLLNTAIATDRLRITAIADRPREYGKLFMQGLPDVAPATRSLTIVTTPESAERLGGLAREYREVGLDVRVFPEPVDAWPGAAGAEPVVRDALGLGVGWPKSDGYVTDVLLLQTDSPLAQTWAAILARRMERAAAAKVSETGAGSLRLVRVVGPDERAEALARLAAQSRPLRAHPLWFGTREALALPEGMTLQAMLSPADFAAGARLPRPPGAFGGVTVLVVPGDADAETRAAWRKLAEDWDAAPGHRFWKLRVVLPDAGPTLGEVLDALRQAEQTDVAIVPAEFCAIPASMRGIREAARGHTEGLTLSWPPGLGAGLTTRPR